MVFKANPQRPCLECGEDIPVFITVDGHKRYARKTRKRCFECSPFKSYKSVKGQSRKAVLGAKTKTCRLCKETLPTSEFHLTNKQRGYLNSYCKTCQTIRVRTSRQRFKEECVAYKGGVCTGPDCNYSRCAAAFDFHHVDGKDFQISQYQGCKLTDAVKAELDRCVLLCATCHREAHYYFGE